MINCEQLRKYIVRPTLEGLGLWSQSAENLILGTAAQETNMGYYIMSIKPYVDYGIYQLNHSTHDWVLKALLRRPQSAAYVKTIALCKFDEMVYNLAYQTALVRHYYYSFKEPLPRHDDIEAMAKYYKLYYNTSAGAATWQQFAENYKRYVK